MNKIAGIVGLVVVLAAVGGGVYFFLSDLMSDVDAEYSVGENLEELYGDVTGHTVNGFEEDHSDSGNIIKITGTYTLADGTTHDYSLTFDMDTKERISP